VAWGAKSATAWDDYYFPPYGSFCWPQPQGNVTSTSKAVARAALLHSRFCSTNLATAHTGSLHYSTMNRRVLSLNLTATESGWDRDAGWFISLDGSLLWLRLTNRSYECV